MKILWWDGDGLTIYYKRLERGAFRFPNGRNAPSPSTAPGSCDCWRDWKSSRVARHDANFYPQTPTCSSTDLWYTNRRRLPLTNFQTIRPLLKRMLVEHHVQREAEIQAAVDEAVQAAVEKAIRETTAVLLRCFYGPRNERFDPRQLLLFGLKIDEMPLDEASVAEESHEELATRRVAKRHRHGRRPTPKHLPRIDIEHDLDEAEKPCPACGELRERIGQEVSEQLEYLPASFKVLRHIRHKYGCRRCEHDGYNPNIAAVAKPAAADRQGAVGAGALGVRRHEQAGRSPAAVSAGAHFRAAERPDRPQHDVARGFRPPPSWSVRWWRG